MLNTIYCVNNLIYYYFSFVKGSAQLPINHRQSVMNNGTLVIRHVQREDSGQYTCVARNREKQGMERSMHIAVVGT